MKAQEKSLFVRQLRQIFRRGPTKGKFDARKLRCFLRVEELETRFVPISGFTMVGAQSAVEGTLLHFTNVILATFSSTDLHLSDFHASVDWGGPTAYAAAGISVTSPGNYYVTGNAVYSDEGNFTITVTVTGDGGGSGTTTAAISDAALTNVGVSTPTGVAEGGSGLVSYHFKDANSYASGSDLSGAIAWGDGTTTSGLSVSGTPSDFYIQATHVYAEELSGGTVTATVTEDGGTPQTVSGTGSISVSDPNVVLTGASLPAGTEGSTTGTMTLATFTDPAGAETAADYAATVDWGDGSTGGTPTIVQSGSTFSVQENHTWKDDNTGNGETTFHVTVTVTHGTSTAQSVTDSATVLEPTVMFAAPIFYTTEPASGVAASSPLTVMLSGVSDDDVTVNYETIENAGCG